MNRELTKSAKRLSKRFFKFMNNSVFSKTMGNVRKNRDAKLVETEKIRNCLASEPNQICWR